jgi:Holliday junction resolvase RusA-like endonuclease
MMITITIPGTPVAKGRARSFIRGGHVAHYTPDKTARYENLVKLSASEAMAGAAPIETPVSLICHFVMPVPASYSKKRTKACLSGAEMPSKKPDLDNMIKAVKDGLNGVAWKDDAQVVNLTASKVYGLVPSATVKIGPFHWAYTNGLFAQ